MACLIYRRYDDRRYVVNKQTVKGLHIWFPPYVCVWRQVNWKFIYSAKTAKSLLSVIFRSRICLKYVKN